MNKNANPRYITRRFIIISVAVVCLLGGVIEILQPILSNRTNDVLDFFANSLGAMLGGYFASLVVRKFSKKQ